jgi:hypothetical protein
MGSEGLAEEEICEGRSVRRVTVVLPCKLWKMVSVVADCHNGTTYLV